MQRIGYKLSSLLVQHVGYKLSSLLMQRVGYKLSSILMQQVGYKLSRRVATFLALVGQSPGPQGSRVCKCIVSVRGLLWVQF